MHPRRRTTTLLAPTVALLLTLGGCATGDRSPGDEPVSSDGGSSDGGSSDVVASLTIVLDETGDGDARTFTLTCSPAGGDHPDPQAACATLADDVAVRALAPTPPDTACTENFGGPQRATVTGELDGERVSATLSRANGCEISRWDALAPVLTSAGGLL